MDFPNTIMPIETGTTNNTGINEVVNRPRWSIRIGITRMPTDMDIPLNV